MGQKEGLVRLETQYTQKNEERSVGQDVQLKLRKSVMSWGGALKGHEC